MRRRSHNSFTLLEMIAVMAVIAVLASLLAPSVVRQIQSAQAVGEDQNLNVIAQGLLEHLKVTQTLPNTDASSTNWATNVSIYTGLSSDKVLYVFPGQSSSKRMLIYDPALVAWGNMTTNVWSANTRPNPARVMLVSSSSADPSLTTTGITSASFTNLFKWNKNYSNGVVDVPTGLPVAWQKKGEFLHIKTIDLAQNFCQVSIRDCYAPIANITGWSAGTGYTNQTQFIFTNQGSIYQVNCDTNLGNVTYVSLISAAGFNNMTSFQTNIIIPGGSAIFTNQPPNPGQLAFNTNLPTALPSQLLTNIVLKGTMLFLQGVQCFQIQSDCEFEFFNQTWVRKY